MSYRNALLDVHAPPRLILGLGRATMFAPPSMAVATTPTGLLGRRGCTRAQAHTIVSEVLRHEYDLVVTHMRGTALRELLRTCPCHVWVLGCADRR